MLLQMLAGCIMAALAAYIFGFLLARYRGIFFGLLSLALSMILYGVLVKSEALGSTDGINILPSTVFGIRNTSTTGDRSDLTFSSSRSASRIRREWVPSLGSSDRLLALRRPSVCH